jgi:hypothetical protein
VTELFHCATERAPEAAVGRSECADLYLARILNITNPKVVVAVGSIVERQLTTHFKELIKVPVIKIAHPGYRFISPNKKKVHLESAVEEIRRILNHKEMPRA